MRIIRLLCGTPFILQFMWVEFIFRHWQLLLFDDTACSTWNANTTAGVNLFRVTCLGVDFPWLCEPCECFLFLRWKDTIFLLVRYGVSCGTLSMQPMLGGFLLWLQGWFPSSRRG